MAFLIPKKTYEWLNVEVKEYLINENNVNNIDMPTENLPEVPLGVTIHNTDWIDTASGTTPAEQYTRATVNGNMNDVRVHFYCDNKCAWQNLPLTLQGWHAADGKLNGNTKTIAIECIMDGNNQVISDKSEDNCARLAAQLLHNYGLDVNNHLFTHTYWLNKKDGLEGTIDELNVKPNSYKTCPIYIIPHWSKFKAKVQKYWDELDKKQSVKATKTTAAATTTTKKTTTTTTNKTKTSDKQIDVEYKVNIGRWLPAVTNCNDNDSNGYAGMQGYAISAIAMKSSEGTLKYRIHAKNNGWLGWISKYNTSDFHSGYAGILIENIDALQIELDGVSGYQAQYRVATKNGNYLPWVTGTEDYAGIFGKEIDKVQIKIIKVE